VRTLIGEYHCKLDAKGRFLIPSGLRKQLPDEEQEEFVMNRGIDQCLVLYPQRVWEAELGRIQAKNQYVARNRAFTRMFLNGATPVTLDGSSRVLVPKILMEYAGLTKDIILVGQIDKAEIWDKEAYEKWLSDPGFDFEALAEEVMGDREQDS
jgi:MraZ protein